MSYTTRSSRTAAIAGDSSYAGVTWNKAWSQFFEYANKNGIALSKEVLEKELDDLADLFIISRFRAVGK